ncbi:MAG: hypothetical protein KUF79_17525 [Candidatus Thiodiazotropha sp. (ex Ctena orbiculata)]|nr:hypothetical protein [Candidatus Thiodiazotropha taylori]
MIRWIVIAILALFFGLSPKEIEMKRLFWLFMSNLGLVAILWLGGVTVGFKFEEVAFLEVSSIIVSGLTILYGLQIGLAIKILRTLTNKGNRNDNPL